MSLLSIAARVAARDYTAAATCGSCGSTMNYNDGRDAYVCLGCGHVGPNSPIDFHGVIAARRKKKKTSQKSKEKNNLEYSVQTEIILSADFEGNVTKPTLIKKFKSEVMASLESAVKIVSRELRLKSIGLSVKPIHFDVAITDDLSADED